jgi:hypothetical protein
MLHVKQLLAASAVVLGVLSTTRGYSTVILRLY